MPAEEGLRLDVDQSVLPCEEPREKDQRQSCSVGRPPGLDLALGVKGELFRRNIFSALIAAPERVPNNKNRRPS